MNTAGYPGAETELKGAADAAPRAGVLAALWVPTGTDGKLKRDALAKHLGWLKTTGIHGVLALGSTGEFIRMSLKEREEVLEAIIELAAPLPVVANLSSIRLDEVLALGRTAIKLGAVGAALMPPSFFPVTQADMLEFFVRAADGVDLPFYLYNFPELTGNRINIETVAGFADRANMAGIKQSGGEFSYHHELIALGKEKNFSVFSGADTRLPEVFSLGGAGAIGGLVNMAPEYMVGIYNACCKGQTGELDVDTMAARMREVGRIVDQMTFPLNVATGVEARGFDPGAPKTAISPATEALYRKVVADFQAQFRAWGLTIY